MFVISNVLNNLLTLDKTILHLDFKKYIHISDQFERIYFIYNITAGKPPIACHN